MDLLLGVDVFVQVMQHGWRDGPPEVPAAFETSLGWVIAGSSCPQVVVTNHAVAHASVLSGNNLLQKFWAIEERVRNQSIMSAEECCAVKHFEENHQRAADGHFIVPLPMNPEVGVLVKAGLELVAHERTV